MNERTLICSCCATSEARKMSEDNWIVVAVFISVLVGIYLITRRWFWIWVFFFSGLASLFAMVASVIHFQILPALGFFVLMVVCYFIFAAIFEDY